MGDLLTAIGLALVVEGLLYGGFPGAAKRMAAQMANAPDQFLRLAGVAAMAIGVLVVWLARS